MTSGLSRTETTRLIEEERARCPDRPSFRERDFTDCDFSGADLRDFDLTCSTFSCCDLRGAKFPPFTGELSDPYSFSCCKRGEDEPVPVGHRILRFIPELEARMQNPPSPTASRDLAHPRWSSEPRTDEEGPVAPGGRLVSIHGWERLDVREHLGPRWNRLFRDAEEARRDPFGVSQFRSYPGDPPGWTPIDWTKMPR